MQQYYQPFARWFRGTNTGYGEVWLSIRKRKLIRPFRARWGCNTELLYKLLPGHYIVISWWYWNQEDPPHRFTVQLVRVAPSGQNGELDAKVVAEGTVYASTKKPPRNAVLLDLFNGRPGYHGSPSLNFSKVYAEEDIRWLIRVAKKQLTIGGGVE